MPKGDVLAMAEVAGIMAAKRTPEFLPLCHPLPIEGVNLRFELLQDRIEVKSTVITTAKTGVEMEALSSVSAALLCIYDLTKIVDPVLEIDSIYLEKKEGGKSGVWTHPLKNPKVRAVPESTLLGVKSAVLVLSDRCFNKEAEDVSGQRLSELLSQRGAQVLEKRILPDDQDQIRKVILELKENGFQLVAATGGTGLGPRDVTPEALAPLWSKKIPGLGEVLRFTGAAYTQSSYLSRSEAGFVGDMLVVLFPGSPKAIDQGLPQVDKLMSHALKMHAGGQH